MQQLRILKDFKFAAGGVNVIAFTAGDVVTVDDAECVAVAAQEGWAEIVGVGGEIEEPKAMQTPIKNKSRKVALNK